jgi:hypothetical protein
MPTIPADFSTVDDLLWEAHKGHLCDAGSVTVEHSARIGPIVELFVAMQSMPSRYRSVACPASAMTAIAIAAESRTVTGLSLGARSGVFPLMLSAPASPGGDVEDQWKLRFQSAAQSVGFSRRFIQGLVGALGELVDNVHAHSRKPETGLATFVVAPKWLEIVVSDIGIGVHASLRENPKFSTSPHAGASLRLAIGDGHSRLQTAGRGNGIGNLFRSLAGHNAEIRFRSDDYLLQLSGESPSLTGVVQLKRRARLPGLTVSLYCPLSLS